MPPPLDDRHQSGQAPHAEPRARGDERRRSRVGAAVRALIRTRVTAGIITVLPIIITLWLVRMIFGWLRDASLWVVDGVLLSSMGRSVLTEWGIKESDLLSRGIDALPLRWQWGISIFSVCLTFFVLYVIGLFAANIIGKRLLDLVDHVADRLPLVKTIYRTLKQILTLFGGDQTTGFKRVALVPFPNAMTRSVAFITNTMRDSVTGDELCVCFIASTPNPTTGFVFVLKRSDVIEVDWSIEDAIKIVMSGGILSPPDITLVTGVP
jgi:uncharacterized membrane protein